MNWFPVMTAFTGKEYNTIPVRAVHIIPRCLRGDSCGCLTLLAVILCVLMLAIALRDAEFRNQPCKERDHQLTGLVVWSCIP